MDAGIACFGAGVASRTAGPCLTDRRCQIADAATAPLNAYRGPLDGSHALLAAVSGRCWSGSIDERQARSIKYQMTIAKLPPAKEIAALDFTGMPINEMPVGDLAIAIGRACVRARVWLYNMVDLVNRLEVEAWAGKSGRIADHLTPLDLVLLDEPGYLPSALSGGCGSTLSASPMNRPPSWTPPTWHPANGRPS